MLASLYVPFLGEKSDMKSVTEPNQVLSVSEILARYGSGAFVSASHGVYDEDDEDFEEDPTRDCSFDFLDAYLIEQDLAMRAAEQSDVEDIEQSEQSNLDPESEQAQNLENSSEQKTKSNENASD